MSHRRKHVTTAALAADCAGLEEHETILRVVSLRGSNIIEVEFPDGSTTLCRMPQKFNKMLWVKRGSFLVAEIGEADGKVNGEVTRVLYADQIKQLKKQAGVWPPEFNADVPPEEEEVDDDEYPPLEQNTNHRRTTYEEDSDSD
mmetsp:Transcript_26616/g.36747  ORF Transcript_26616/g.36747 Transcript_26616/m.36747 type:complete len:144 (-) Transcript_26616:22-453(-)